MPGLNDKQMEACSYTEGPLLILAGAGSGKTRVITHRIAYLINEKSVDPYNILAITFTNKAAKEMRSRVDTLIGNGSESIWVSTFHSMCVRILRRFYDRIGGNNHFSIYDDDEQKTVVKEVLKTLQLDPKMYPEKLCMSHISKWKEECLSPKDVMSHAITYRDEKLADIYNEYEKRMRSNNALDFDDLIFMTIKLFEKDSEVLSIYQDRFKYIMVDEYQDTNHSQFVLVSYLAAKYRNLCVVGDDDQSIYKFRGANIKNILNFENEYPDAKVVKLEQNYRSTSNILNAANNVVANNAGRKDKSLWTSNEEGEILHFKQYQNEYDEALGVTSRIMKLVRNGADYSDVAILYRTNRQSRVIEEKFINANIPYKIVGGTNFYDRKEIKDILGYLKVVDNPSDSVALQRIINVPRRGIGNTTVNKAMEFAYYNEMSLYDVCVSAKEIPELQKASAKLSGFVDMMEKFRRANEEESLENLFDMIISETGYTIELKAEGTDEAKSRLENIDELKNRVITYMNDADEPTLNELLEEIALVADADSDDDETGKVSLMTLHSAKGLEFPYVFIVGMEDGLFPSKMSLDTGDPEDEEEERRLCYVGITRAMKELYLSCASSRMINGVTLYSKISRFVDEIPDAYIDKDEGHGNVASGKGYSGGAGKSAKSSGKINSGFDKSIYGMGSISKGIPATGEKLSYGVGDTVRHIKFGKGKVVSIEKSGSDHVVVVDFEKAGEKKVFASLAKLKKL